MNKTSLRFLLLAGVASASLFQVEQAHAVQGAEVYSKEAFGYGRYEARIQFAPGNGVLSTFFLWKPESEKADIFWVEADIEKLGEDCLGYSSNAIYGLTEKSHEEHISWESDLCTGYHTHGFEWTPDALVWTLDGVEVRRLEGETAQAFAENAPDGVNMRFNIWRGDATFGGVMDESILPVHQYQDWAQFSEYTPGEGPDGSDYTLVWRDDFDQLDPRWSLATWDSPKNLSTHNRRNVTVVDGIMVLSMTADGEEGYDGTPPQDTGGSTMPVDPVDPVGPGGADGGTEEPVAPAAPSVPDSSGGCSVHPGAPQSTWAWLMASILGIAVGLRRQKRFQS